MIVFFDPGVTIDIILIKFTQKLKIKNYEIKKLYIFETVATRNVL